MNLGFRVTCFVVFLFGSAYGCSMEQIEQLVNNHQDVLIYQIVQNSGGLMTTFPGTGKVILRFYEDLVNRSTKNDVVFVQWLLHKVEQQLRKDASSVSSVQQLEEKLEKERTVLHSKSYRQYCQKRF
jgi:hypothetical protein